MGIESGEGYDPKRLIIAKLIRALERAKPIVGSAAASATSHKARVLRQAVHEEIESVLTEARNV